MAHIGKLPNFQRIVTGHNSEGKAIIHKDVDTEAPWDGSIEGGKAAFSLGYTTKEFPVNMNGDKDLQTYKEFLGKPPGLVQNSGSVLRIVVRLFQQLSHLVSHHSISYMTTGHGTWRYISDAPHSLVRLRYRTRWGG